MDPAPGLRRRRVRHVGGRARSVDEVKGTEVAVDCVEENLRRLEAAGGKLVLLLDSPSFPPGAGAEALEVADAALASYRILDGVRRSRAFGVICNSLSVLAGLGRFVDVESRLEELSAAAPMDVLTASVGWRGVFENACLAFSARRDGGGLLETVATARRLANRRPAAVARWAALAVAARTAANRLATWARWEEHATTVDWFEEVPAPLRGAVADDYAVLLADWAVLGMDRGDVRDSARAFDRFRLLAVEMEIPEVREQYTVALSCAVEVVTQRQLPAPELLEARMEEFRDFAEHFGTDEKVAVGYARTLAFIVEGCHGLGRLDGLVPFLDEARRLMDLHAGNLNVALAVARAVVNGAILRLGPSRRPEPEDPVMQALGRALCAAIVCCPGQDEIVEAAHRWHRVTGRSIAE